MGNTHGLDFLLHYPCIPSAIPLNNVCLSQCQLTTNSQKKAYSKTFLGKKYLWTYPYEVLPHHSMQLPPQHGLNHRICQETMRIPREPLMARTLCRGFRLMPPLHCSIHDEVSFLSYSGIAPVESLYSGHFMVITSQGASPSSKILQPQAIVFLHCSAIVRNIIYSFLPPLPPPSQPSLHL